MMEARHIPTTCLLNAKSNARLNQYRRERKLHSKHGSTEVGLYIDDTGEQQKRVVIKAVKRNSNQDRVKSFKKKSGNDPPSSQQSIEREIAILKACFHPSHVELYEVIDDPSKDTVYIALEYLSGGPVHWEDNGVPSMTEDQCRRVVRDVVVGLDYLHYHGIIHRDIKPANLIWSPDRSYVKIIDYGISHFSERRAKVPPKYMKELDILRHCQSFKDHLTKVRGTGFFYAPEVVWCPPETPPYNSSCESVTARSTTTLPQPGHRPPITEAVDIWCLGVTVFCFLFGRFPFIPPSDQHHATHFALNREILYSDWSVDQLMCADRVATGGEESRDVDGHVLNVLDRMLKKDPSQRIELSALKSHSWLLEGVGDPETWLYNTDPSCYYNLTQSWLQRSLSALQNFFKQR